MDDRRWEAWEQAEPERALRAARKRANARVGFHIHAIVYLAVCALVLVAAGLRPALLMGLAWGIGLAIHYLSAVVAPDLRRRYIEREVSREMRDTAPRERRDIEDRHVRSLEELSAQVAHEIRNPITAAKSLVQQMGEDPAATDNVEFAKVALEELDRVERSVAHLLRYAREEELALEQVDLHGVVDSAVATFQERADRSGVEITRDLEGRGLLRADADKLRRVVINLIGNALDALEASGVPDPRIEISAGENLAGTECWLRVRDNGPGIHPDVLSKIWSPFYTSKQAGTGLGLALSKKVLDAHGGSIEATTAPGGGAEFTLVVPRG